MESSDGMTCCNTFAMGCNLPSPEFLPNNPFSYTAIAFHVTHMSKIRGEKTFSCKPKHVDLGGLLQKSVLKIVVEHRDDLVDYDWLNSSVDKY
jgi:hypothetical protein